MVHLGEDTVNKDLAVMRLMANLVSLSEMDSFWDSLYPHFLDACVLIHKICL